MEATRLLKDHPSSDSKARPPFYALVLTVDHLSPEATSRMVSSLAQLQQFEKVCVVIVRNACVSGSVPAEQGADGEGKNVRVVHSEANTGYFGGARQGMEWFLNTYGELPQWVVVCNNDIRLTEQDFFVRLSTLDPNGIGVIAPRIISSWSGHNQNPFMARRPSRWRINELRFWLANYYVACIHEAMSRWKHVGLGWQRRLLRKTRQGSSHQLEEIYAAHGSFLIFSKQFFTRGGFLDEASFLFHEEISVAEMCRGMGLSIVYHPELCVIHDEHSSTGRRFTRSAYECQKRALTHLRTNYLADLR